MILSSNVKLREFIILQAIAEGLKDNKTLKILNLESNYISGDGILKIFESININLTMEEFRVANQVGDANNKKYFCPMNYVLFLFFH